MLAGRSWWRRGLHAGGIAMLTLAAVVLPLTRADSLPLPVTRADSNSSGEETQFVARINTFRENHGLEPLTIDARLSTVARNWSAQMAGSQRASHNPDLASEDGPAEKLGENVGNGESVDWLERSFEQSPEHEKNLLDPDFRLLGVGVVDTPNEVWVTEDFKQPQEDGASPVEPSEPAPAPTSPDAPAGRVRVLAPAPTDQRLTATSSAVATATALPSGAAGPAANGDGDAAAVTNLRHALATWNSLTG